MAKIVKVKAARRKGKVVKAHTRKVDGGIQKKGKHEVHTVDLGDDEKLNKAYGDLRSLIDKHGFDKAKQILEQQRQRAYGDKPKSAGQKVKMQTNSKGLVHHKKGSPEAHAHMAKLRALRTKKAS